MFSEKSWGKWSSFLQLTNQTEAAEFPSQETQQEAEANWDSW